MKDWENNSKNAHTLNSEYNFHFIRRLASSVCALYSFINIATSTSICILLLTFIPILYWIRFFHLLWLLSFRFFCASQKCNFDENKKLFSNCFKQGKSKVFHFLCPTSLVMCVTWLVANKNGQTKAHARDIKKSGKILH